MFKPTFIATVVLFVEKLVSCLVRLLYRLFNKIQVRMIFPLALAFLMSAFANYIPLAAIVGAFAAGIIVTDESFGQDGKPTYSIPVCPVFFVHMGMQVNLSVFVQIETIYLATTFTIVAIVGKLVSGYAAGSGIDKLYVDIDMIPLGEVGLNFAGIGKSLGAIDDIVFSAIVTMVIVTTPLTQILLKFSLGSALAGSQT